MQQRLFNPQHSVLRLEEGCFKVGTKFQVGYRIALLFLIVSAISGGFYTGRAAGRDSAARKTIADTQTTFFIFNLVSDGTYDVTKNGGAFSSLASSINGTGIFSDIANTGDTYVLIPTGVTPSPPSQPVGFSASGGSDGCMTFLWVDNPEPNVVDYIIYYATESVEQGTIPAYTDSITGIADNNFIRCGFAAGTYYFALRARNSFGLRSPLSAEDEATVTVVTQPPAPPRNVTVIETSPGCATMTWQANSEPDIEGYWVYYGDLSVPGQAPAYSDSADAGSNTHLQICEFSQGGTFYFAVKAYNTSDEFSGYSAERTLRVDVTPPSFTELYPDNGATSVFTNSNISFVVNDAVSGVDTNSITVRVNGIEPSTKRFSGGLTNLLVSCSLADPLPASSAISVSVTAADLATFANVDSVAWSFTTGDSSMSDVTPPTICCMTPEDGSINVPATADISFQISDDGSGIDFTHVAMMVNDTPVEFSYTGNAQNATITYENTDGFDFGTTVTVSLVACDRSSPPNCSIVEDQSFQVQVMAVQTTGEQAEIVPDGFWANNPARPLEVRNLPLNWTVRIFNTAGIQVRSYTNRTQDGYDWLWNEFRNDAGKSVARALYLIRIVDESGNVRRSGRFLVQKDP
jgi:hypothetical protein